MRTRMCRRSEFFLHVSILYWLAQIIVSKESDLNSPEPRGTQEGIHRSRREGGHDQRRGSAKGGWFSWATSSERLSNAPSDHRHRGLSVFAGTAGSSRAESSERDGAS
jgi:hypothetical protein